MKIDCVLIIDGDCSKPIDKSFLTLPRINDYLIIDDVSVIVKSVVIYNKLKREDDFCKNYNDERYVILTETVSINIDAFVLDPVKKLIESR